MPSHHASLIFSGIKKCGFWISNRGFWISNPELVNFELFFEQTFKELTCTIMWLIDAKGVDKSTFMVEKIGTNIHDYGWDTLCFPENFTLQEHFALLTFAQKNSLLQIGLVHFAPQLTLPLSTLCLMKYFSPLNTLLPNPLCILELFFLQHNLLLNTCWSSKHHASQHTLLLSKLSSSAHFTL